MKILLIGAGQLGSRHLQGLLKIQRQHEIFVLDPSSESLIVAEQRAGEIESNSTVTYHQNYDLLPSNFDLVFIATSSNIREKVINQFLNNYHTKYLVLEKVLFQEVAAYKRVEQLLTDKGVKTWVNHPRRLVSQYQKIKEILLNGGEKVSFNVTGGNWGLGCNGLHFLDLFTYLTSAQLKELDGNWLDNIIHESKRQNYVEFTGSLKGRNAKSDSFIITSFEGDFSPISIVVSTPSNQWIIQEGSISKIAFSGKINSYITEYGEFKIDLISDFTTTIANDILENGKCDLPSYGNSSSTHIFFIEELLSKYNEITNSKLFMCPIT